MSKLNVISSDSHVVEEPDLWQKRMDPKFRDRAPHMVREKDRDTFYCEGQAPGNMGILGPAGRTSEELASCVRFEDNRRGGYDPEERLKDMATDGVDAEVLYPTAGFRMFRLTDVEYQQACFAAYNDWLAEMVATHPDRLAGVGLISLADADWGVSELHRSRKLGLASGMIAITPDDQRPYSDPHYEPFWAAAEDLAMPVGLHILTGTGKDPFKQFTVDYASQSNWIIRSLADMIFSGVFERHPKLKVVSVEADIGWIPNFLKRIDHIMERHGPRLGLKLDGMPSDYFKRNVVATYIDDTAGLRLWDMIGADSIMWSNDYPHTDSSWPNSQAIIARDMVGIPVEAKRKILAGNAAALYGFD